MFLKHVSRTLFVVSFCAVIADDKIQTEILAKPPSYTELDANYKAFTGKIVGGNVRMRLHADVDSTIIKELSKGELVIVRGEKADFYAVEPPADLQVYIFRSFVLDNVVEGNRVNVRLTPELNAPVVTFMNAGDKVNGSISDKNHKWLEMPVPKHVRFFVAKEYIDKIGGPELKATQDKKQAIVLQLMDSAELLSQSEMMKPFEEIDFERISASFVTIMHDYSEFPEYTEKAKTKLALLQEVYLQKKVTYLESKASKMHKERAVRGDLLSIADTSEESISPKDRNKIWERVEESLFLTWSTSHHKKTIGDYYDDEKMHAVPISGIVETYNDIVKNKPGNYVLRDRDMPRAYLYSTFIDLQNYIGKYVTLLATPRPNNNFAFPAYFILEVEK